MNQLDKDIEVLDYFIETSKNWMPDNYYKLNMRILNYMKELQMLRPEIDSVKSQIQITKQGVEE